jgi:hypothetical protein
MPHYFFRIRSNEASEREVSGRDYPNLWTGMVDAQEAARKMIHKRPRRAGMPDLQGCVDVEDEHHRPVARIMLSELARQLS